MNNTASSLSVIVRGGIRYISRMPLLFYKKNFCHIRVRRKANTTRDPDNPSPRHTGESRCPVLYLCIPDSTYYMPADAIKTDEMMSIPGDHTESTWMRAYRGDEIKEKLDSGFRRNDNTTKDPGYPSFRHSGESRCPVLYFWIPAPTYYMPGQTVKTAGMTTL